MNTLRTAFPLISLAALALAGCSVEGSLTVEPMVNYKGQPVSDAVAYTAGQSIHIQSRMGDVIVRPGGSGDEVAVTFEPFILDDKDNEAEARRQINEMLNTTIVANGDVIDVQVFRDDGASGNLGADAIVTLPSTFDGSVEVDEEIGTVDVDLRGLAVAATDVQHTGPGDVTVLGAAGPLTVASSTGDCDVHVASWPAVNGSVRSGTGDLFLAVPAGANGSITALADGVEPVVYAPDPLPEDWEVAEEAPNSKSFTFGDGEGGTVNLSTELGNIVLSVE